MEPLNSDKAPSRYEVIFHQLLHEDLTRTVTDKIGGKLEVPDRGRFLQGKNGKGIGIAHDSRAVEDDTGQMVEVKSGESFRKGDDGKGIAVAKGENVTLQPNGSLKIRKKPKRTPPPGSLIEALILSRKLAHRLGSDS